MTDNAVLADLGERFRRLRLRKNQTQRALADRAGVSVTAIKSLETGKTRLATAVAVLRELGELEQLDRFIAEPELSPMQLARMGGKTRERATGSRKKAKE